METKKSLRKRTVVVKKSSDHAEEPSAKRSVLTQLVLGQWIWIFSLIFGGCCSNVFILESIVSEHPNCGTLVTFCQFLLVSVEGFLHFFDYNSPYLLKKPLIPMYKWFLPVAIFFAVSLLNNRIWVYDISMPVYIIFRSGGTVSTMLLGFLVGKRYTICQILGVLTLTIGLCVATLYGKSQTNFKSSDTDGAKESLLSGSAYSGSGHNNSLGFQWNAIFSAENISFLTGVALLTLGTLLTAIQGLVAESLYSKYGKHWRENLFYTHFMSLVFFMPISGDLVREFRTLATSQPRYAIFGQFTVSKQIVNLIINALTQYICVRGVNNLAGQVPALTVTIVLNIRKFISLLLSVYLFGNELSMGIILGTCFVFLGTLLYSWK